MLPHAHACCAMYPKVSSFSQLSLLLISLCSCLLQHLFLAFRLQVSTMFTSGGSTIGFAPLQSFGVYPWQIYESPDAGPWLTAGVHKVAPSSTALSRQSLVLLSLLYCNHSIHMVGYTALGAQQRVMQILPFLHGEEWSF